MLGLGYILCLEVAAAEAHVCVIVALVRIDHLLPIVVDCRICGILVHGLWVSVVVAEIIVVLRFIRLAARAKQVKNIHILLLFCWWDCRLECEIQQAVIIVGGDCLFGLACNVEDVNLLLWLNFGLWLLLKFFKNIFGFGCLEGPLFFFLDLSYSLLLFLFLDIAGKFSKVEGFRFSIFLQILEPAIGLLHM